VAVLLSLLGIHGSSASRARADAEVGIRMAVGRTRRTSRLGRGPRPEADPPGIVAGDILATVLSRFVSGLLLASA
jgi:hypothetical protein